MIKFNEVTWYSKLVAIIFFLLILPVLVFCIGYKYQQIKYLNANVVSKNNISKTSSETGDENKNKWSVQNKISTSFEYPTGWHVVILSETDSGYMNPDPIYLAARDGYQGVIGWHDYTDGNGRNFDKPLDELKTYDKYTEIQIKKTDVVTVYEYSYENYCGIDTEERCTFKGYFAILLKDHQPDFPYNELRVFEARPTMGDTNANLLEIMKHVVLTLTP